MIETKSREVIRGLSGIVSQCEIEVSSMSNQSTPLTTLLATTVPQIGLGTTLPGIMLLFHGRYHRLDR